MSSLDIEKEDPKKSNKKNASSRDLSKGKDPKKKRLTKK
jgi:hypothetical protein